MATTRLLGSLVVVARLLLGRCSRSSGRRRFRRAWLRLHVRRASAAFRGVIVLLLGRFAAVRRRHRCPSGPRGGRSLGDSGARRYHEHDDQRKELDFLHVNLQWPVAEGERRASDYDEQKGWRSRRLHPLRANVRVACIRDLMQVKLNARARSSPCNAGRRWLAR